MSALRHWPRIAITLLPVLAALLHAAWVVRLPLLERLDNLLYDTRLRATMPGTLDPRIVIVDIDDPSLQRLGQWPWSRDKLARLTEELIGRQQAAVLGFDVVFAETDGSSGLPVLRELASGPLRDERGFTEALQRLAPSLDRDALFAQAVAGHKVALGYYFTQTRQPRAQGLLPAPLLAPQAFPEGRAYALQWNGFGANIAPLARAAAAAGFLNAAIEDDDDGVLRAAPLIARYQGDAAAPGYYESLGLAVYRLAAGSPPVAPRFAGGPQAGPQPLEALVIGQGAARIEVPVDQQSRSLVPFRGPGGAHGGSFRYVSAADVLDGRLAAGELRDRIVLVGATAPALQDLRTTPISATYPGVEVHANLVSGLLDGRLPAEPDYAPGYDVVQLLVAGLLLAFGLSLLSVPRALLLTLAVLAALVGLNTALYLQAGLVLPLAAALVMTALAFVANMSWGYFVEARARRSLARLFGTYVPPQIVKEMLRDPGHYTMRAQSKELTVMFCDMRGFTRLSEQMAPAELQAFLNTVFSRLTEIITTHRGTVDKYMGDCVMAFWGAPVDTPEHAELAVRAALEMVAAIQDINRTQRDAGRPEISVGIGLNTGVMSVGDMGSTLRRSYTVVGDAVNLASRLEGLSSHYGVEVVASDTTRQQAGAFAWLELDRVQVRGRAQVVTIFTPVGTADALSPAGQESLNQWDAMLAAYRAQDWQRGQALLAGVHDGDAKKVLYLLYKQRLASMAVRPKDPDWDAATRFDSK